jgi:hypothetical protein
MAKIISDKNGQGLCGFKIPNILDFEPACDLAFRANIKRARANKVVQEVAQKFSIDLCTATKILREESEIPTVNKAASTISGRLPVRKTLFKKNPGTFPRSSSNTSLSDRDPSRQLNSASTVAFNALKTRGASCRQRLQGAGTKPRTTVLSDPLRAAGVTTVR